MGIPVIATNRGGMAELITHEKSGLLFEMDDVVELREQIQRLLNEPQLLPQLREGVPPVKTIDEEMVEIVSAYHTLVKKPDPS